MDADYILEWFRFADADLEAAEHLMGMPRLRNEIICFHCQQSAEKNLKGYLVYHGITEPPRTHELDKLCAMCAAYDTRFLQIKRACDVLTRYGVQPRYPHEIEVTEHTMKKALEYARTIQDFALLQAARRELEEALTNAKN